MTSDNIQGIETPDTRKMNFIKRAKFWQLPGALKLVVVWFFLLALQSFWRTGSTFIETRSEINLGTLISGIINLSLAMGLINKDNGSRKWAALFAFLGSLFGLFFLPIAVFKDPDTIEGFNFSYEKATRIQTIEFLAFFLTVNAGVLVTLLRHKTKILFVSQTSQEGIS